MDIISKEEDFYVKDCKYVGLRPSKAFQKERGSYALIMKGAIVNLMENTIGHRNPTVQIQLLMDHGQDGGTVNACVRMEDCLDPESIPPIAITSDMIIHSIPTYGMVLAMLAGPTAKLKITLIEDEKVRFNLTIGTYRSKGIVPLEKVKAFMEREPT